MPPPDVQQEQGLGAKLDPCSTGGTWELATTPCPLLLPRDPPTPGTARMALFVAPEGGHRVLLLLPQCSGDGV